MSLFKLSRGYNRKIICLVLLITLSCNLVKSDTTYSNDDLNKLKQQNSLQLILNCDNPKYSESMSFQQSMNFFIYPCPPKTISDSENVFKNLFFGNQDPSKQLAAKHNSFPTVPLKLLSKRDFTSENLTDIIDEYYLNKDINYAYSNRTEVDTTNKDFYTSLSVCGNHIVSNITNSDNQFIHTHDYCNHHGSCFIDHNKPYCTCISSYAGKKCDLTREEQSNNISNLSKNLSLITFSTVEKEGISPDKNDFLKNIETAISYAINYCSEEDLIAYQVMPALENIVTVAELSMIVRKEVRENVDKISELIDNTFKFFENIRVIDETRDEELRDYENLLFIRIEEALQEIVKSLFKVISIDSLVDYEDTNQYKDSDDTNSSSDSQIFSVNIDLVKRNFKAYSRKFAFSSSTDFNEQIKEFNKELQSKTSDSNSIMNYHSHFELESYGVLVANSKNNTLLMTYCVIQPLTNINNLSTNNHSPTIVLNFYDSQNKSLLLHSNPVDHSTPFTVRHYIELSSSQTRINYYLSAFRNHFYSETDTPVNVKTEYYSRIMQPYIINSNGTIQHEYSRDERANQMHQYINLVLSTPWDFLLFEMDSKINEKIDNEIKKEITDEEKAEDVKTNNTNVISSYYFSDKLPSEVRERKRVYLENNYLVAFVEGSDNNDEVSIKYIYNNPVFNHHVHSKLQNIFKFNEENKTIYNTAQNAYWLERVEIFSNINSYFNIAWFVVIAVFFITFFKFLIFLCFGISITPRKANDIRAFIDYLRYGDIDEEAYPLQNIEESNISKNNESNAKNKSQYSYRDRKNYDVYKSEIICKDNYSDYKFMNTWGKIKWNIKMGLYGSWFNINRLYQPRYKENVQLSIFKMSLYLSISVLITFSKFDASEFGLSDILYIVNASLISIATANILIVILNFCLATSSDVKSGLSTEIPDIDSDLENLNDRNISSLYCKSFFLQVINILIFSFLLIFSFAITSVFKVFGYWLIAFFFITQLFDFLIFDFIWSTVIALCMNKNLNEYPNFIVRLMIGYTRIRNGV